METILTYRKYAYIFSGILVAVGVFALVRFGLTPGIDFTGGTLMEVGCEVEECTAPTAPEARAVLAEIDMSTATVQATDTGSLIIRYSESDEAQNEKVLTELRALAPELEQLRVDFIGASVSQQLTQNAIDAIIIAIVVITVYIAWAFRKVSFFVSSWAYGVSAIIALVHDIVIVIGVFALLGHFMGVEVGISFVAALLTVLGYSVNDTIVVYDRIRENLLRHGKKKTFEALANQSVRETIARSFNTSMTVVVVLVAVLLFGGATLFHFALALLIGVLVGTYSSIFIASALLVTWYQRKHAAVEASK